MAESAEVLSLDVLLDLRVALVRFAEDAKIALQDVEFQIRRTQEWLANEQRLYWQSEIRRWHQKLSQAKTELHRKKLARFSDRRPDTSQEEKAVKLAEGRLDNAQRKLERVKRWVPELQHAVQEYRGQAQPMMDLIDIQLVRDLARLDRMIEAIEDYARLAAPRTPGTTPGSGGRSAASGMGRGDAGAEEPPTPAAGPGEGESQPEADQGPVRTGGDDDRQLGPE